MKNHIGFGKGAEESKSIQVKIKTNNSERNWEYQNL
jgi:hypothetical protein